jgi:hypothetical protein
MGGGMMGGGGMGNQQPMYAGGGMGMNMGNPHQQPQQPMYNAGGGVMNMAMGGQGGQAGGNSTNPFAMAGSAPGGGQAAPQNASTNAFDGLF